MTGLHDLELTELSQLMQRREVSPVEVAEHTLGRFGRSEARAKIHDPLQERRVLVDGGFAGLKGEPGLTFGRVGDDAVRAVKSARSAHLEKALDFLVDAADRLHLAVLIDRPSDGERLVDRQADSQPLEIDLSGVELSREVRLDLGTGDLTVLVDDADAVDLTTSVGVGRIEVFGDETNGLGLELPFDGSDDAALVLDIEVGAGKLVVEEG